jgi:Arf-GAP/SH3 domain/ANK repeat/PH domain-containing protein
VIKGLFSKSGIRGRLLNIALHHQHSHVYQYDRSTVYGCLPHPSEEMTLQFLDMAHYGQGGRLFTYVLTLDSCLRFTETGKEYGIDLLSKHTMHSDVSIYIAFSGEFFVRVLHKPETPRTPRTPRRTSHQSDHTSKRSIKDVPKDPTHYELIIDNSSGTYRPEKGYLPLLECFLQGNFPGLHIRALACDDEELVNMKEEQAARKKREGPKLVYLQGDDSSSISSSDEEELEVRAGGGKKLKKRRWRRKKPTQSAGKWEQGLNAVADPKRAVKTWISHEEQEEGMKSSRRPEETSAR